MSGKKQQLVARAIGCPKPHVFHDLAIFWSAEKRCKHTFFHPPLLFPVTFATATVVAFVLLGNSRFDFHCYTQREPTPTQKSARKWQLRPFATSRVKDYERYSLVQSSFTEPPDRDLKDWISSAYIMLVDLRGQGYTQRLYSSSRWG